MEKASNVYVYPTNFGWNDLGTWSSLYTLLDHDKQKNAVQGYANGLYPFNFERAFMAGLKINF